jgi:Trk K+ transport system NAD-binding subunit
MNLGLPRGALIALVVRKGDAFVPAGRTILQQEDRVLLFAEPGLIPGSMERLGIK